MIITKTPIRISLAGGGSDYNEYFREYGGAVLNTAIDKYIYVTLNKMFENQIRVSYAKTEMVENAEQLEHGVIRESLKKAGILSGMEVVTVSDIPAKGTGMGSSSSAAVGVLNALYQYKNETKTAEDMARDAYEIEREILKFPVGKQDQYIAAYGGFRFMEFNADESVKVTSIKAPAGTQEEIEKNLLLFYTGLQRNGNIVLDGQKKNTEQKTNKNEIDRIKQLAYDMREEIEKGNANAVGKMLHENWTNKKKLAVNVSNSIIDEHYEKAISSGAEGGKLCGAGGGGFLLFYCKKENQQKLRDSLKDLHEMKFSFEPKGSQVIFRSK